MGRIIINNESELPDSDAVSLVLDVIKHGRVSNNSKQYCYATHVTIDGKKHNIISDVRRKSDSFTVYTSETT